MPESYNHAEFARLVSMARLHALSAECAIDLDLGTSTDPRQLRLAEQGVARKQVEKALGDLDVAVRCLKLSIGINPEIIQHEQLQRDPSPVGESAG